MNNGVWGNDAAGGGGWQIGLCLLLFFTGWIYICAAHGHAMHTHDTDFHRMKSSRCNHMTFSWFYNK